MGTLLILQAGLFKSMWKQNTTGAKDPAHLKVTLEPKWHNRDYQVLTRITVLQGFEPLKPMKRPLQLSRCLLPSVWNHILAISLLRFQEFLVTFILWFHWNIKLVLRLKEESKDAVNSLPSSNISYIHIYIYIFWNIKITLKTQKNLGLTLQCDGSPCDTIKPQWLQRNSKIFSLDSKYCGIRSIFNHENIVYFLLNSDSTEIPKTEIPKHRRHEKTPLLSEINWKYFKKL